MIIRGLQKKVQLLCSIALVSTSGYYKWRKHTDEPDKDHEDYLLIKKIFEKGKSKLGWRSIAMELKGEGIIMNHKKISRIMRKYCLFTKIRRPNPYRLIMEKTLEHMTFPNKLDRKFDQTIPHKKLVTDITYLFYNHRVAYLSTIKDIASGEIVGWYISQHIDMDIVMNTLKSLVAYTEDNHISLAEILIHSDQGFHYTNPLYVNELKSLQMTQSMSRKGNCIDNAPMESFFGHLKDDADYNTCKTFPELKLVITEYIHYYNHERYQWDLKKMTPVNYRNHLLALAT